MSNVDLYLDQENELRFKVSIAGSKLGTPKYRLALEGKDLSYSFAGQQEDTGEVLFCVPSMKNVIKEGTYNTNLEVMIDDRYFIPLTFNTRFEESVRIVAESMSRPAQKKVGVSASIVTAKQVQQPVRIAEVKSEKIRKQEQSSSKESVAEFNGRSLTANDLREMIRSGKF